MCVCSPNPQKARPLPLPQLTQASSLTSSSEDLSQWVSRPGMPRRTGRPHRANQARAVPMAGRRCSEQTGAEPAPGPPLSACEHRAHFLIAAPARLPVGQAGAGGRFRAGPSRQCSAPRHHPTGSLLPPRASWSAYSAKTLCLGHEFLQEGDLTSFALHGPGAGSRAQHLVGTNRTLFSELVTKPGPITT